MVANKIVNPNLDLTRPLSILQKKIYKLNVMTFEDILSIKTVKKNPNYPFIP
jgi:hypothetical protein